MRSVILRLTVLFIIALALLQLLSVRDMGDSLRDWLTAPGCLRGCWLGIEPGVTTIAEVERSLNRLPVRYTNYTNSTLNGLPWIGNYEVCFDAGMPPPLANCGQVNYDLGVVNEILLFTADTPTGVTLDTPERVTTFYADMVALHYARDGIILVYEPEDGSLDTIHLTSPQKYEQYLTFYEPLPDCGDIIPGCATATPAP